MDINQSRSVVNHGNSGSTETIDPALGPLHSIVLDQNCVFTFSDSVVESYIAFNLLVKQDSTGSRLVTWPSSVLWSGGTDPVLSTVANAIDIFSFFTIDGGVTWFGIFVGKGMS